VSPTTADTRGATALVLAFVAVTSAWVMVEMVVGAPSAYAATLGLGLGAGLGLLHGLVWTALLYGSMRLRMPWRDVVRGAFAVGVGVWLAASLGGYAKLGTRNQGLAITALVASSIVAMALFTACRRFAPDAVAETSPRRTAFVLLGVMIVATIVDRTVFVGLHPSAHATLRGASLAAGAFALLRLVSWRPTPPRDAYALLGAVAIAGTAFVRLHGVDMPTAMWGNTMVDQAFATQRGLTDVDGDGFSALLGGGDCDAFDPEVNPAAIEIADNGIDENCIGGDATAPRVDVGAMAMPTTPSPRSVLLVTIETLRADHMGMYGYARDTTPVLDRWAEGARVYERAFTPGAWTSIAVSSLLRGVNARRMTWVPFAETDKGRLIPAGDAPMLERDERGVQTFMLPEPGVPTVATLLRRRGMSTAAVVDDRFSELLDASVGTDEGFEVFVDADVIVGRDPDDQVVDLALQTLAGLPKDRPFFLWVHLFGPHSPNTVHEGVPQFGDTLLDGYDHEIRFVDAQVGRLLEGATARDPALAWFVTADHGEVLLEGDRMHGMDLSIDVIRVPLVVGGTTLADGREPAVVSTLDIVPTILGVTETPAQSWLDGRDLREPPLLDRVVLVDTWHRGFDGALLFDLIGATDGSILLVLDIMRNATGLADLHDPTRTPSTIAADYDIEPLVKAAVGYRAAAPLIVVD
jgi:arylsulfatase A-like enzyme